jgi:arsenate reductase
MQPIDLVRTNEALWKSEFKGKTLSHDEIINAMLSHPKLIERPIVTNGNKAVVGRPTERIQEIV